MRSRRGSEGRRAEAKAEEEQKVGMIRLWGKVINIVGLRQEI